MKRICFVLLFLSCFIQSRAQDRTLVWSDEFNAKGLPYTSKWGREA